MKYILTPLILYIMAAPLTELISLDLRETDWLNLWTYAIWAFAGGIYGVLVLLFIAGMAVAAKVLG